MAPSQPDSPDKKRSLGELREAWLGLVSSAESEWHKATHRLLEALGVPEGAPAWSELVARMKKNREEFERRVDEGVKNAVALVRAPIDREIATLKTRIERLTERLEERRNKGEKKQP